MPRVSLTEENGSEYVDEEIQPPSPLLVFLFPSFPSFFSIHSIEENPVRIILKLLVC